MRACLGIVAALLVFWPGVLFSADGSGLRRLRSSDPLIAALIAEAERGSTTFRNLLERLMGTDGLVYVETGRCGHGVRSCVPHAMTRAGRFRLVHILIDPRDARTVGVERLVGIISHELQHAVELLSDPAVTSGAAMFMSYRRDAPPHGAFETPEATLVGDRVSQEMEVALNRSRLAAR